MANPIGVAQVSGVASARARRSRAEHQRVRTAFDVWLLHRRAEDAKQTYQQYTSQFAALANAIHGALSRIELDLVNLSATSTAPTRRVFAVCAQHDLRLAWIQRLWFYFRHKFDQRDDRTIAPLLKAADEVVWSCYKPAFEQSGVSLAAAPLPYLEPLYSPQAILRAEPPRELLWNTDDKFARSCLASLPIPVIGLPASAVGAPWLLGLLAHEVGHHVQADLDGGDGKQVRSFGEALRLAAQGTPRPEFWLARGREVFADVFSALAIGSATLPILAELLVSDEEDMFLSFDSRYPAPRVRLALINAAIRSLGLPPAVDPHGLDLGLFVASANLPPAAAIAIGDLPKVAELAEAALTWQSSAGLSLPQLLGWSETPTTPPGRHFAGFEQTGNLAAWTQTLVEGHAPVAPAQLESPRLLAGAGVLAWAELLTEEDAVLREENLDQLATLLVATLPTYREQMTRAGDRVAGGDGSALADQLMNATEAELSGVASLSPATSSST